MAKRSKWWSEKRWVRELQEAGLFALVGVVFHFAFLKFNYFNLTISVILWVLLAKGNGYLVDYLNVKISWINEPVKRTVWGMVVMIVYSLVAFIGVVSTGLYLKYDITFQEFISKQFGLDDLLMTLLVTMVVAFFFHGRAFYFNWKNAVISAEKYKNESLRSQFESLKNQVNPHFLFNSLNVLSSLVYEDQKGAVEFIRRLSQVYRYVLDTREQELVRVEEELLFLKNYVYLQQIRFGESLNVQITGEADGMVPPLAIQMLVENAIKHNVVSEKRPLHVRVTLFGDQCEVTNNFQEKLEKDSTGIGLSNIRSRYQFLTERKVEIVKTEEEFVVRVPLLNVNS